MCVWCTSIVYAYISRRFNLMAACTFVFADRRCVCVCCAIIDSSIRSYGIFVSYLRLFDIFSTYGMNHFKWCMNVFGSFSLFASREWTMHTNTYWRTPLSTTTAFIYHFGFSCIWTGIHRFVWTFRFIYGLFIRHSFSRSKRSAGVAIVLQSACMYIYIISIDMYNTNIT